MEMQKDLKSTTLAAAAIAACAGPALAVTTTFDNGTEGWSISGRETISQAGGSPGANLDAVLLEIWGPEIRNDTNPAFTGDLSRYGRMEFSIDVKINSHQKTGFDEERSSVLGLSMQQYFPDFTLAGLYIQIGTLDASVNNEWTTYSVIIDDPFATDLPRGWVGVGDYDIETGTIPQLPDGSTFASVIQNVDRLSFVTGEPGTLADFSDWHIQVDNITLRSIPAPGTAGVVALLGFTATRRRR